jgi:hypothetical protein
LLANLEEFSVIEAHLEIAIPSDNVRGIVQFWNYSSTFFQQCHFSRYWHFFVVVLVIKLDQRCIPRKRLDLKIMKVLDVNENSFIDDNVPFCQGPKISKTAIFQFEMNTSLTSSHERMI